MKAQISMVKANTHTGRGYYKLSLKTLIEKIDTVQKLYKIR